VPRRRSEDTVLREAENPHRRNRERGGDDDDGADRAPMERPVTSPTIGDPSSPTRVEGVLIYRERR
jgi:hypothetical protein